MKLEDIGEKITYCNNEYEAMESSDALIIITEWNQFRNLDLEKGQKLACYAIFFSILGTYMQGATWSVRDLNISALGRVSE